MKYLSKNTEKYLSEIDNFFDDEINIDKRFKKYYDFFYKRYFSNNSDYELLEISKQPDYITSKKKLCGLYELLKYLIINNLCEKDILNKKVIYNKRFYNLKDIVKDENNMLCKLWFNLWGNELFKIINDIENIIPSKYFEELYNYDEFILSQYIPIDILEYLELCNIKKYKYVIKVKNTIINLEILTKNGINLEKVKSILKRISLMVGLKENIENFTIKMILTNFKKNFDQLNKEKIVGSREINSGLCVFTRNLKKIILFRNEEHSKLIIHELIHLLKIDFHLFDFNNMYKIIDIDKSIKITLNEALTEFLALIINCIVISIELKTDKNDYLSYYKLAKLFLIYEIKFNIIQCAKILNYFGYLNNEEFFRSHKTSKFKQNTCIISYFFVKTALLLNNKKMFDFLDNNFNMMIYKKREEGIYNFINLSCELILNPNYQKIIQKYQNKLLITNKNMHLNKTLRMTCINQ